MKTILFTVLAIGAVLGETPATKVEFLDDVKRFKTEAKGNKLEVYRSGQYKRSKPLYESPGFEIFPVGHEEDNLPVNPNEIHVYQVVYDNSVQEIGSLLMKEKSNSALVHETFHPKGKDLVLRVSEERHVLPLSTKDVDSIVEIGKLFAKTHLKAFRNKIEYESRDLKIANGKLFEVDIRFRRIFKGMVVRKNVSYVYMTLGADGIVRSITVRWPKFIRAKAVDKPTIDSAFSKAEQHFQGAPIIRSSDGIETPLKATVKAVAKSWVPTKGDLLIYPGYAFIGEVTYDNGDPAQFIFDYSKEE